MHNREELLTKRYFDNEKFPYGFSRSGDFSIAESQVLESIGTYYKSLYDLPVKDCNDDEIRLKKVFEGKLDPESFEEKTWLKYIHKTKRRQIWLVDSKKEEISDLVVDDDDTFEDSVLEFSSDLSPELDS